MKNNYKYFEKGKLFLIYSLMLLIIGSNMELLCIKQFFDFVAMISFITSSYCILKSNYFNKETPGE